MYELVKIQKVGDVMRFIDVDAVWDRYENESCCVYDWTDAYNWLKRCIDEALAIDAEPVRHGKWIKVNPKDAWYQCSECLGTSGKWNYCPYCGARMDGD